MNPAPTGSIATTITIGILVVASLTAVISLFEVATPWLHPWLRISPVVRAILTEPWPPGVWPSIKDDVSRALALRERLAKAYWWN